MAKYRTWHIVFMRKGDAEDLRRDPEHPYYFDSTEFDVEGKTIEEVFPDLYNLFAEFCVENKIEEANVNEIYEVPYDGEEEE